MTWLPADSAKSVVQKRYELKMPSWYQDQGMALLKTGLAPIEMLATGDVLIEPLFHPMVGLEKRLEKPKIHHKLNMVVHYSLTRKSQV